ncbi:neuralized-like protein 4 [Cephus cinctus]|uniref:Neuralized-like protein 4 n=1 Tax=Cephus cinctus TaxID=211228 RepID=A0AAJ7BIW4_CEPCN|nr:neuralized-like protein 4 [Cephus cinctus]
MAEMFHRRCGDRVNLINNNCTAVRNFSEYNYGLVLSAEPLKDDELFEIRIDKKMISWSGSIEIGVTSCDPESMELPACATKLRHGSWIMSGLGIVHDGQPILEIYGTDLDTLEEGDTLGVMRSSNDELIFYVNGTSQGIAATNIPSRVFAVIDMYGNCVQVTITHPRPALGSSEPKEEPEINNDYPLGEASSSSTTNIVANLNVNLNVNVNVDVNVNLRKNPSLAAIREDRLRFHERVGSLVKLSNNARTAERQRPLDEFNNGVVMTHRPLRDNELFEIRIDRLVDKWSGSIEVGVTTHSPTALDFPATMTNMRSGTTMMSGCGILTNGKGTQREYGEFNLDELREGDRVGMIRRGNGNLHYLINGLDQGIAAKVPAGIWGVIDLYGMTVKVTIVDRDEREEQNLVTRRNTLHLQGLNGEEPGEDEPLDRLMFHMCCGTHADVINNGRTAHRPNAMDDFNNGVVLTSRPLRPNELFEVKLDKIVTKWAGSIEIGVTTHSPTELEFPFTMTNVRTGTWMMTGNGVMHNGTTMIDQYGQNLDRLQVGDRVGVMRKDNATLHFYVNGADQGAAAMNVPEKVYGVIDLYGQAAQATIVDVTDFYSPTTNNSSFSNTTLYSDLRFHHVHGKNARITNNGLTASRPRALGEFNEAIVVANRALRDGEMFEVSIDKMVNRWSGAIEAGVTAIRPDELEFPSTMTDIDHDTWMLSGSTVMRDGVTVRNNYSCDLDKLMEGNRIGMMRHPDTSLHYYLDGVDQGVACTGLPLHVYPVIDLYGQCAQVTIVLPERRDTMTQQYLPSENSTSQQPTSVIQPQAQAEITHKFHESVGVNIQLNFERIVATRCREYDNAVLLSECALENNEIFEIAIQEVAREWSGSLRIGVVSYEDGNWLTSMNLVPAMTSILADAWYLIGNEVRHKGYVLCLNYCPSLDWLRVGDKIGMKRTHDGHLKFYVNGEDMGVAASNVPEMVYAIIELFGSTLAVSITSSKQQNAIISPNASLRLQDSLELLLDPMPPTIRNDAGMDTSIDVSEAKLLNEMALTPTQPIINSTGEFDWNYEFHENHGRNVEVERKTIARRVASYNQGVVMTSRPLIKGKLFQVKVEKINDRWVSGMLCGVTCISPEKASFPLTALGFKKHSWIICGDWISHNGTKVKTRYGANLENLQNGFIVGLLVDEDSRLHLYINGSDQGIAATDLPPYVYAVIDLYGQCEQISIFGSLAEPSYTSNDTHNMAIAASVESTGIECEDVENSREKADLECHEKENAVPATPSNLSLNIPSQSDASASDSAHVNCIGPYPSQSNNITNINNIIQNKAMSSSVHSDSNNSDTGSELSNDARSNLSENSKIKNHGDNANNTNDYNAISNNQSENNTNELNNDVENHGIASVLGMRSECTNVEINNATNINIKNGTAANTSNMSTLNTAINSTNANNAINESIASNSQTNNMATSQQNNISNNILTTSQNNTTPCQNVIPNLQNNVTSGSVNNVSSSTQEIHSNVIRQAQIPNNCLTNSIVTSHTALQNSSLMPSIQVTSLPSTPLATLVTPTKKCEYMKACVRLKKSLVLPDEFFSPEEIVCYCCSCHKVDGDTAICRKGEPPAEFAIPVGWARFPLKQSINVTQVPQTTLDKWHVAFYGTRLDAIRWILDRGELLTKEQLHMSTLTTGINSEDVNPQVVFSPNIKYAASEEFTTRYPYIDTQSNKKLNASTAFQLLVRPGSYTMSPGKESTDQQSECTEWATKEAGATVIVALLIHLDGF